MPKYQVTLWFIACREYTIDAKDRDEAGDIVCEMDAKTWPNENGYFDAADFNDCHIMEIEE